VKEIDLDYDKKFKIYLLSRFYDKSVVLFQDLAKDLLDNKLKCDINRLVLNFSDDNIIFKYSYEEIEKIFHEFFAIENNMINLEELFNFFDKKYEFKINILNVINLTLEKFTDIYNKLILEIKKFYQKADFLNEGFLTFNKFESFISYIFLEKFEEQKWKVVKYFR